VPKDIVPVLEPDFRQRSFRVSGSSQDTREGVVTVVDDLAVHGDDDEAAAKFALIGMTGRLSIQTMRAFTESEADKLIKSTEPPPG